MYVDGVTERSEDRQVVQLVTAREDASRGRCVCDVCGCVVVTRAKLRLVLEKDGQYMFELTCSFYESRKVVRE